MTHKWILGVGAAGALFTLSTGAAFANTTQNSVTVQPGQTLWTISQSHHSTTATLEAANPTVNPENLLVGTVIDIAAAPGTADTTQYTVQAGDSFWIIAHRFGIATSALMAANPGIPADNLLIGTVLTVPDGSGSAASGQATSDSAGAAGATVSGQATSDSAGATVSASDLYWMEHVINAEANSTSLDAQIAVGDVIWHRLESPGYPKTVQGVVFQKSDGYYQFDCVPNGYIYTTPSALSDEAAVDVLEKHVDLVPGAMIFFDPAQTPSTSWVWSQPRTATLYPFIFAK